MIRYIVIFIISITTAYSQTFLFGAGITVTPPVPPTPGAYNFYVDGNNSGSEDGSEAHPYNDPQDAASIAGFGQTILIKGPFTYRQTIVPTNSGVTFVLEDDAIISGLNLVGNSGWTVHSGNIYKKTVTLPNANNYVEWIDGSHEGNTNTVIMANQVFKDSEMMPQARWPNVSTPEDLFDRTKFRYRTSTSSWTTTALTDPALGAFGNLTNAQISMSGWFLNQTRQITSQSGNTINYSTVISVNGEKFRHFYYVTNHLALLDAAKEWHYQSGVLYFYQPGGGSPTGVEIKIRNWAFDLRGKNNTTIRGGKFIGCDAVMTDGSSGNTTVDGIDSRYPNHSFITMAIGSSGNVANAQQCGLKLLGANSTFKNSRIKYAGAQGVWLGEGGLADNNHISYVAWTGMWGAAFKQWKNTGNSTITRNTIHHTGRGAIEYSGDEEWDNVNLRISYNDLSYFNLLSTDGSSIYSQLWTNHNGMRVDHNIMHDSGVYPEGGIDLEGLQATGPVYFDQASGGGSASGVVTLDHNIMWNGNETDFYTQTEFEGRDAGTVRLYNNTFATTQHMSYEGYSNSVHPTDQKNNIYLRGLYSPNESLMVTNSIMQGTNPLFNGGSLSAPTTYFGLQAGSPGVNTGVVIPGITDGYNGSFPDAGAVERGVAPWVAGCSGPLCN